MHAHVTLSHTSGESSAPVLMKQSTKRISEVDRVMQMTCTSNIEKKKEKCHWQGEITQWLMCFVLFFFFFLSLCIFASHMSTF